MHLFLAGGILSITVTALAFDSSEYRQNTYGVPNHYCDPTRSLSSSGSGTVNDPWNMAQCANEPVAGDIVGVLPGVSVALPVSGSHRIPAFQPRNSGTATNRIVYVTRYAAIALSGVAANPNRTELRHSGSAPQVSADGNFDLGTGCPILGSYFRNYITFDGFYIDMARAYPKTDSGVLRVESATGIHFRNFEIKGATTNMQSNPIIYRPQDAVGTVLSNFRAYDFRNDPTGSTVPQAALFSDQYGDQDFLIENFEIRNTQRGLFLKGTANNHHNYGTIRNGIVSNVSSCFQFNDLDPANLTTLEYSLCHDVSSGSGINISSETSPARNLLIHHNTVAKVNSADVNTQGGIYSRSRGFEVGNNNVTIRDNLIDINMGPFGHGAGYGEIPTLPQIQNFNAYTKNGSIVTFASNGVQYNTLASWSAATGKDVNSRILSTSPFMDRANNNFRVLSGHEAKTTSSTSGEVGCYASTRVIGIDTVQANPPINSRPAAPRGLRVL